MPLPLLPTQLIVPPAALQSDSKVTMLLFTRALILMCCCKHALSHTPVEPSFHSSAINHGRMMYDRPRRRPKRRGDIPHKANEPIALSRYVNYGKEGHPYEQVRRLREGKEESRRQQRRGLDVGNDREILRILQNDKLYQPLRIHFDTVSFCAMHIHISSNSTEIISHWPDRLRAMVLPIKPNFSKS